MKLVAKPHQIDVSVRQIKETIRMGRRPKMLPSGTQMMFEVPRRRVWTCKSY